MARIRTIKPEFPQSESMGRVSRDARLLFILLWPICDDHGRTRAASRMLASLLFPYDDDAPRLVDAWLSELESEGCIRRYEHEGSTYLEVCKWLIHQKIDKPSKPQFPAFDESLSSPREPSRILAVGSGSGSGSGPGTKEEEQINSLSAEADDSEPMPVKREPSRFHEFWAVYPRNEGKKLAGEVWRAKKLDRIADRLIADVRARVERHRQWMDGFAPHASKYLRQELWQDEISSAAKPNGAHQPKHTGREAPMLPRLDLGAPR